MVKTQEGMVQGIIVLTEVVDEEEGQFASYCRELGTSSCGDTIEEAFANLEEAIGVHVEALEEAGERDRFFRERNINILLPPVEELFLTVPIGKPLKTYQHPITIGARA